MMVGYVRMGDWLSSLSVVWLNCSVVRWILRFHLADMEKLTHELKEIDLTRGDNLFSYDGFKLC